MPRNWELKAQVWKKKGQVRAKCNFLLLGLLAKKGYRLEPVATAIKKKKIRRQIPWNMCKKSPGQPPYLEGHFKLSQMYSV